MQEIGRAGRDGNASKAVLIYTKPNRHTTRAIKEYAGNKALCRRQLLYRDFIAYTRHQSLHVNCDCCDNCALACKCVQCNK